MLQRWIRYATRTVVLGLLMGLPHLDANASESHCPLRAGTYLSRAYLDVLLSTKSPYEADIKTAHAYNVATVRDKPKRCEITPETFHEGGMVYIVSSNHALQPGHGAYPRPTHFEVTSHNSFKLGFSAEEVVSYEYVGKVDEYVSTVALVGRYADATGRVYEFRSGGGAEFPDRKFRYEIGLDHALTRFDYFYDPDKVNAITPFRRDGEVLYLFTTKEQENKDYPEIDTTKPPITLRTLPLAK